MPDAEWWDKVVRERDRRNSLPEDDLFILAARRPREETKCHAVPRPVHFEAANRSAQRRTISDAAEQQKQSARDQEDDVDANQDRRGISIGLRYPEPSPNARESRELFLG
jgi:hypothetical protein